MSDILRAMNKPVGTVLYVGAGPCPELQDLLEKSPECIVLVEPDKTVAELLQDEIKDQPRVLLIEAAVAEASGVSRFQFYNDATFNSLRPPEGLQTSYPGLRLTGQATVRLLSPKDLLAQVSLSEKKENWLIVDAPGEEAVLLKGLALDNDLSRFSRILLRSAREVLFQNARAFGDLKKILEAEDYDLEEVLDESDPDRMVHLFCHNPLAAKLRKLKQTRERERIEARCALAALSAERDALQQQIKEKSAHLSEIRDRLETVQAENQDHQQNLNMVLRQKSLAESDLKQFQSRYAELFDLKEQQDSLLQQLTKRLGEAAEYLQTLQLDSGDDETPAKSVSYKKS